MTKKISNALSLVIGKYGGLVSEQLQVSKD